MIALAAHFTSILRPFYVIVFILTPFGENSFLVAKSVILASAILHLMIKRSSSSSYGILFFGAVHFVISPFAISNIYDPSDGL